MKNHTTPPCSNCGKRMKIGNTNGLPNMVGFVLGDGRTINLCQDCITRLGELEDDEKEQFVENLTK